MLRGNYEYQEGPKDELKGIARNIILVFEELKTLNTRIEQIEQNQMLFKNQLSKKPEFLSVGEVALKEGVCAKTVRNRIKEGSIPAVKNDGERSYKIPSQEYHETRTKVKSKNSFRNVSKL